MSDNRYTPATIRHFFSIPLYQRLFSWDDTEVKQLLNDLYSSFRKSEHSPYYIGMLTVYKENADAKYSLVDGQQRFTVLNLMAIIFEWKEFLKSNDEFRLTFFARKNDEEYLKNRIEKRDLVYTNEKMEAAIKCIENFMSDINEKEIDSFKNYIKTKTTFFLSELPNDYTVQDLNRYFEAMNEAGKGLENHEILKVRMLRRGKDENKEKHTKIWNAVSEMDRCLIRQKDGELQVVYREKIIDSLKNEADLISLIEKGENLDSEKKTSILNISASSIKPSESERIKDEKAILGFSDFLLQILWLSLPKEKQNNKTNFFNKFKLLETFDKYVVGEEGTVEVESFFENLLRYRVLFDYFIIRLNSNDNRNTNYSLNMSNESLEGNHKKHLKRNLIQFQSMLYVSSQSYTWLTPLLEKLNTNIKIAIGDLLSYLKYWDNKQHNNSSFSLNYGVINRYWFWRLDYYLWENKEKYFDEAARKIADNYIFRTNRSIEHIAPQNPKSESQVIIDPLFLHSFGNLAMISAGQNSSLQNECYEIKKAHVISFLNGSTGGTIESLKMLNLHKYDSWNDVELTEHHNKMIGVLINSFKCSPIQNSSKFKEIIKKLEFNKCVCESNQISRN